MAIKTPTINRIIRMTQWDLMHTSINPGNMYMCIDNTTLYYDETENKRVVYTYVGVKTVNDLMYNLTPTANTTYYCWEDNSLWLWMNKWIVLWSDRTYPSAYVYTDTGNIDPVYRYDQPLLPADDNGLLKDGSVVIRDRNRIIKGKLFIDDGNDNLVIYLNCLDASCYLANIVKDSTLGITYFSATLYPIDYYHKMLVGQDRINYLELESPFDVNNLGLYISPVSTRYQDRKYTISYIRELVNTTINNRYGKYIVFFPSYVYLNMFLEDFSNDNYKIIVQKEGLNEQNQIEILEEFNKEQNVLGLFVLGGVFAEGIDFIGDKLHGVIVVGVGFPQINLENEILKDYFTSIELAGFDYAYTYPGFNKVIQAAGRVIRTEQDKGIVLLLDDRYLSKKYLNLYPKHWNKYKVVRDIYELDSNLTSFWNK